MELENSEEPPDRFKMVTIICLLQGVGVLISWHMFINAWDYFTDYKLCHINGTDKVPSPYVGYFMQYLTFTAQLPNVIFTFINAFVRIGGGLSFRILGSLSIVLAVFIFTLTLSFIEMENVGAFFWMTMCSVALMQVFNAIYQNSLMGMAAILPPWYIGYIIIGNNVCGTFTSITKLVSKSIGGNHKATAIYYFSTAIFVLVVCLVVLILLKLIRFYKYYLDVHTAYRHRSTFFSAHEPAQERPYWLLIKQTSTQLYNVFMTFMVTLTCFPAILSNIKSGDDNFFISTNYYGDVMCFLNFNVSAMIGSIVGGFYVFPKPRFIWIAVTIRIIFIPIFLFCNYTPPVPDEARRVGVLIYNDYVYLIFGMVHGFTCGYYTSACLMIIPGMVDKQYAHIAGMLGGVVLILGIFFGIMLAFLWPLIMWESV
ncbi:equilibrative nucleoside transporter 1-like [Onthophagus taurus]|uniref:equilibrative nucleoside transporter 1-like n=1 Tax=Onthophagus taurus TaxID=166361 RepID=UPI000C20D761|nr:equilibrative nucleoside transporter 1-like [Onthophagus taurus]